MKKYISLILVMIFLSILLIPFNIALGNVSKLQTSGLSDSFFDVFVEVFLLI